ncbi:glucose-6-phosphate dehydrogenase [Methylobacterium sp. Leaf113]|uniref:glucose-6-phosphate dehydrogenase n=1 Tax=Methylobacterium sp. Leaf113 TaxID=1736259 RepID=UPI0006F935DF|nr:glucose-6-phosphate dehydrogenase [Methylobacterium sp. Leaf113]KQP94901.1 glucose-6-phosphate dehydrogenase [Methylobacterium sp. Leaf113]
MDQTPPADAPEPEAVPAAPPCTLVIFGAGGDLTKRLLMPALYNLAAGGLLDPGFRVIGVDHNPNTDEGWRKDLSETMQSFTTDRTSEFHPERIDPKAWGFVRERLSFRQGDFTAAETFSSLAGALSGNVIFYLAVSARFFGPVVDALGEAGLLKEQSGAFRRVVIEKPFGSDLDSARALNARILKHGTESQFFRIDHFLGKETVQSILAIRFANGLLGPVWHRDHIDHVEITAAETIGVEARGAFYEPTGALRDMVPNHLFQLLCMVAMEPPATLDAEDVRDAKARLIQAVQPVQPAQAVRGQYGAGREHGHAVPGYRDEPNVAADSRTETYVALKLSIDNPRWKDVPFYLRTGKRMTNRVTEIALHFRPPARSPFAAPDAPVTPDVLRFRIDPEQGMDIVMNAKRPGPRLDLGRVTAAFDYGDFFKETPSVGYETLLYDCLIGDATLFQRADSIEAAWAVVDPLLKAWIDAPVEFYSAGSDGPEGATALLAAQGHRWLPLGEG